MSKYSVVVTNIDLKPEIYSATGDQMAQGLTSALAPILKNTSKACETIEGGGWEILSHQVFRIGDHLLVSFLLRHQSI